MIEPLKPRKFYVKSGSLQVCLIADSALNAAAKAIKLAKNNDVGEIVTVDYRGFRDRLTALLYYDIDLVERSNQL